MTKKLILMVVYDKENETKSKCELFFSDHFKDLYKIRNDFKTRKDIKAIKYEIYQMIEEKLFEEVK